MKDPKQYRCLRCGIAVYEWRGLCTDCLNYARREKEGHIWIEDRSRRRERMAFLNQIGIVPNVDRIKQDRRRRDQEHRARRDEPLHGV